MASSIFVKPNTGRIKRRTLPASGEKATFHVKQPGAAGRGGAFCRLRAEISCQGGKALLLYLKGGQRSISKATVGFKGSSPLQRQCERHFKRLLRQIAAEGHHLNICATTKLLSATHAFLPTGNGKGALILPFVRTMRHGAIHVSFIRIGFQINAVGVSPSYSGKVFYHIRAFQQFVSS